MLFGTPLTLSGQTLSPMGAKDKCDPLIAKCAMLYLDGAVRTADKKSETTAATGAIGVNLARGRWELATLINVASATDTIRRSPGESMLVPGSGGLEFPVFCGDLAVLPNRLGGDGACARLRIVLG
jgi:hypothetical protein